MTHEARAIGIVACSAEGAALCYRTICLEAQEAMGRDHHPDVAMHTHSLGVYMDAIHRGRWDEVGRLMADSAARVAAAGAAFAICPDNTIHQAYDEAVAASPIPWLHIAETVAEAARSSGFGRLAVLGTGPLMDGPVYRRAAGAAGIEVRFPEPPERERVHRAIFDELVQGELREETRADFVRILRRMAVEDGCEAAVLGCTEIPLLIREGDAPIPTLDSTRLLARRAIREALS